MITTAYVYKWTHKPTLKWYVGVRWKKGCHPKDGYICSSKSLRPIIESNPQEWVREVIKTGEPADMRDLEETILYVTDAKRDKRSFNQHNGNGKFINKGHSEKTRKKIGAAQIGELNHMYGKVGHNKNKSPSLHTRSLLSKSKIGKKWWNNGKEAKLAFDAPSAEWQLGRLKGQNGVAVFTKEECERRKNRMIDLWTTKEHRSKISTTWDNKKKEQLNA
jgi:hypothetical protein